MGRRVLIGMVLLALSHAGLANLTPAFAQAGSIGGSVGKQDKTISGSEEADRPRATPYPKPPAAAKPQENASGHSCSRIVGRWSWYLGVSDSVFRRDGSALHPASGTPGKWTCAGDTVSVVWATGATSRTDRITLLPDGSIFVDSPWGGGIKFTGTRRGGD
jgi:hypothetical protein